MKLDFNTVVRITDSCNLRCNYCSQSDKNNNRMTIDILEKTIHNFLRYNDNFAHFTWTGGEPLLMKDHFFEKIIEFENRYNIKNLKISNSIQSNGSFPNKKRLNFLKSLGFKLGFSYDGLDEIQDKNRKDSNGKSISHKVKQCLRQSSNTNTKKTGIISVVTKDFLGKEKHIFNNYKKYNVAVGLNLCTPVGDCLNNKEIVPTNKEMTTILLNFYELWKKEGKKFEFRPFTTIIESMKIGRSGCCEYSTISCYQILAVNYDGKVYTCVRSTHMPETYIGDLNIDNLETIVKNPIMELPFARYELLKNKCQCEYFSICSGGCLIESLQSNNELDSKTYYCETKKTLFTKIKGDIINGEV